jgi:1-acyl-sn-glycerol-3-phosphate acyltransferase
MWAFFSRIEVEGRGNVPDSGPVLLVPNHTNALVDGLMVGCCLDRPITMTVKSKLAGNPVLALMMRAANVITFQRRQDIDREDDMKTNEKSFSLIRKILERGGAVCVFPEGKSHSDPRIRKFKTGAARIALAYRDDNPTAEPLLIVPVGLYFQDKGAFRSNAWIGFGKPVPIEEWKLEHPGAGAADLTGMLENRVREITLNFDQRAQFNLFLRAAELLATQGEAPAELGLRPSPRLSEQLRLVRSLQQGFERLMTVDADRLPKLEGRVRRFAMGLARRGVALHEVFLPMNSGRAAFFLLRELELMILGLPLALWGLLTHLLPLILVRWIAGKLTHDEDQRATNVIFAGVLVFPLFYVLQLALAALFLTSGWLLVYLVSVPYCGAYAIAWFDRAQGAFRRSRTFLLWRGRADLQQAFISEGLEIISEIHRLNDILEADYGTRA